MSVVDDIKARLDIVETVSGYVPLQKSGRYLKASCPFHTEKTPSFIVNPERQSWRCFGACATGGDAFSFVMRMEKMEFGEALRLLAQKTGISLSDKRDADRSESLYRVNQAAARFYRDTLESSQGQRAMKYLQERGVSAEAMDRFELGLSPAGWDGLKTRLLALGFAENQAVEAGLLKDGQGGKTWDFFKGRLMFPIHNKQGRVAGFGARALDDSKPKYLNTARTPTFDKRSTLYALHMAAEPIRTDNTAIVVEGYMDVIAAHQFGYTNVVASMGTALTEQQVSQLKSLATNFVLALDPDAAGQEATMRSLESSWRVIGHQTAAGRHRTVGTLYQREPITLKIAPLPPGRDPDQLIREDSKEWERLTAEAAPLMDYLIPAVASRFDLTTGHGKAQVAEVILPLIESAEFLEQERYLRRLAEALEVSEESLKASIGRQAAGAQRRSQRRPESSPREISTSPLSGRPQDSLEDYLLALLLSRPVLKERVSGLPPEYFHRSEDREVYTRWLRCSTIDELRESLDESLHDHLAQLMQNGPISTDSQEAEAALTQCLQRLERRHLQELQESLLASEDASVPPPREIESAVADVNARLKELYSQPLQ